MNRQQKRSAEALEKRQDKVISSTAKAINNTMLILEASPFPVRLREAYRLLTKRRTNIQAANNLARFGIQPEKPWPRK